MVRNEEQVEVADEDEGRGAWAVGEIDAELGAEVGPQVESWAFGACDAPRVGRPSLSIDSCAVWSAAILHVRPGG